MTEHVLVAGAGIAGLGAALALGGGERRVTLIDRDSAAPTGDAEDAFQHWERRGATQLRHSHVFLGRLTTLIQKRYPELLQDLLASGARIFTFEDGLPPPLRDTYVRRPGDEELSILFSRRTTLELVWKDANMNGLLRWGNWAVAKLVEFLFNTSHLSDVGCTYRLLRRETARFVAGRMTVGGSHAGAEIMLLTILSGARFVEVPVNYLPRVGKSSVTGNVLTAVSVGLSMVDLILSTRLRTPLRRRRPAAFVAPRPGAPSETERQMAAGP